MVLSIVGSCNMGLQPLNEGQLPSSFLTALIFIEKAAPMVQAKKFQIV